MKFKSYKHTALTLCLMISVGVFAQKTSKKFTERFSTNKDVEVQINASNAEIDVTTWNKNEVLVEAFIEVEGISKKKAEEYLKNYKFEALGNSRTVKINASSGGFRFNKDFVIFNNDNFKFPEIVIPEMPEIPEIVIPEIKEFKMPDIDFENIFIDMDDFDFDGKDNNFTFKWDNSGKKIVIKSKKDWEKFKKSKDYKKFKEEMKAKSAKIRKELADLKIKFSDEEKKRIKESIAKARASVKRIDMSKIRAELAKAKAEMKRNGFVFNMDTDNGEVTIDGKKVKIKKRIVIRVPKKATFDLNTRHCKVKLPKSKASGKVSYGSFKASGIDGGDLKISFSPVTINSVEKANLVLNNVTDAVLASVANSVVNTTSGSLKISELLNGVNLSSSYGDIQVLKVNPEVQKLKVDLRHADAFFNFLEFKDKLIISTKDNRSKIYGDPDKKTNKIQGTFSVKSANDLIQFLGLYSELVIKK